MSKVHVDTQALYTAGTELQDIMGNLASTAKLVAEELVAPIVKVSGSEKLVAVGEDLESISEDALKQAKAAQATNENIESYTRKLAEAAANE